MTKFMLTDDHLKLLRKFNVGWQDTETGAPEIDPKRPYGNSGVWEDIAEILGWATIDGELSDFQVSQAEHLHKETETALQIVLSTGQFKAGKYSCKEYTNQWKLESKN